jgi:hydroxylamine dehydrogenase
MRRLILLSIVSMLPAASVLGSNCVDCHKEKTPNIVSDWQLSKHAQNGVTCETCHGTDTQAATGAHGRIPTLDTCATCHAERVAQFKRGKHALAWVSMNAMPTTHFQPMAMIEGMKGCGGCHKIGVKTKAEIEELKEKGGSYFGIASCDSCHTRHTFSMVEARQPQACQTCHMGFDHPQWQMYSSSKHGVRYLLKQNKILPESTAAPTCQTCHMPEGNHEVRTAWGFLAVRLPMPEDKQWAADRATVLQGLGVLDPSGQPANRLGAVKAADVARLTQEGWQLERDKMLKACSQCHSPKFSKGELEKGDQMIREADHLMAEAIRIVAKLYEDGVLKKPATYTYAFPDLLTFHDAATVVEQKLFVMFFEHRMRAFQGAFHANPDYALWYGWSEMQRDLAEIKLMAGEMRGKEKSVAH